MDEDRQRLLTDSLLEQLPIGVILTDDKGDMVFVNRRAEYIRKVRREDLLGRNILNCHQAKSQPNVQACGRKHHAQARYYLPTHGGRCRSTDSIM